MNTYDFSRHKNRHVYIRLILFVRQYWLPFGFGILGTILTAITTASFTWLLKPLLDKGFIARDMHFIHWLPFLIIVVGFLRCLASYVSDYYLSWVGRQVVMRFRQEIFTHLLKMPATFYDQSSSGYLLSAIIYNVDQLASASTNAITTVVQESFFIISLLIVMLFDSWRLTLIFFIAMPIIASVARYANKRMRTLSQNLQQTMGDTTHIAQEAIEGYQVIRIFAGQQYEYHKFSAATQSNRSREVKVTATNSLAGGLVQQAACIALAAMVYIATAHGGHITAGGFASLMTAMLALLKPMKNLSNVSNVVQKGIVAAESAFALLDTPSEVNQGQTKLTAIKGTIEFKAVCFKYPNLQHNILSELNFTIPAGKTTAIVGRSGSGKSTIVKLIPHFYDDYQGEITLDDIPLRALELNHLRSHISFVSQHIMLFNDSIKRNIAYGGMSQASEAEIINAAKAAFAHDFIMALPKQYDSLVGDQGVLLSGGQRQRIAIARAILKNAPILILDEATSALDNESEYYIQKALTELIKNRTTIIIAHRLSTVEHADQILVFDQGRLIEQGTHQTLLEKNSSYAKLYRGAFLS
jgi:ATP-binding cassette, subfamily B, bacterial MsbA